MSLDRSKCDGAGGDGRHVSVIPIDTTGLSHGEPAQTAENVQR